MQRVLIELWKFRALVEALVKRHVATRYRGSLLGFLWSLLNPLCLMAVYTLVFHYYMRFDGGKAYHVMVFAGLLPWLWTASALSEGTSAIAGSGHLITKSMFPAHVLPFVSVASTLVNFILALPVLAIFIVAAGLPITFTWLALPVVLLAHGILLFGLVLGLSALNVFFRDVQHIVANLLTFLFFLCPVVYPASVVPEKFSFLLKCNPFALLTTIYQGILIHGTLPTSESIVFLVAISLLTALVGALIHDLFRERFAEAL
jgi:ABC-type polysaccharide/polyol phosphate export permease